MILLYTSCNSNRDLKEKSSKAHFHIHKSNLSTSSIVKNANDFEIEAF